MTKKGQFGVWMDNHQAIVIGGESPDSETLSVLARVRGGNNTPNSSEHSSNNNEKTIQAKFFKEIASHMTNATHVHVTGTGQAQEQFIHYLKATPQFKNSQTAESTSNKMSDEKLVSYIGEKL